MKNVSLSGRTCMPFIPYILYCLGTSLLVVIMLFTFPFLAVSDGYIPGRDTIAWWADGKIEILRGHDFETGEEQYYLYIEHSSAENGHVRAYKRTGNPVQVLVDNKLYTIDENTLAYTVQTLSAEEIPLLTQGFRWLKP